jgi:DNA-directed RNA polymerase subunit RPC12/RpoP
MATATGAKVCVNCNKDVTHGKRMKDSQGRYWCLDCGTEDSKKKHTSKVACADCRGKFKPTEIQTVGEENLCANCILARGRSATAPASSAATEAAEAVRAQKIKLILAVSTFLGGIVLMLLYFFEYIG